MENFIFCAVGKMNLILIERPISRNGYIWSSKRLVIIDDERKEEKRRFSSRMQNCKQMSH